MRSRLRSAFLCCCRSRAARRPARLQLLLPLSSAKSANTARGTALVTVLLKSNSLHRCLPKRSNRSADDDQGITRCTPRCPAQSLQAFGIRIGCGLDRRERSQRCDPDDSRRGRSRPCSQRSRSAQDPPPWRPRGQRESDPESDRRAYPASATLRALKTRSSSRERVRRASFQFQLAGPIDGSAIWWANGFTGQGTSADGNGSPDAVVFDTGLRTTHDAFKTRLPGDCANLRSAPDPAASSRR